jgi:hypothetical protein
MREPRNRMRTPGRMVNLRWIRGFMVDLSSADMLRESAFQVN